MDTIYALASARGKAGVAIIRVSGPAAFDAVRRLCDDVPAPRHASLRRIVDGTGAVVDHALVLTFAKNASFTGEESAEFHLHGSIAIVQRVLKLLGDIEGLRLADPGEFTRRAFVNGTMDLSQVEGLSDLIEAETEAQRVQAMRVFSGGLGDLVQSWRTDLVRAMALLEATIDFADEDVPEDVSPEVLELVSGVRDGLTGELRKSAFAERVRDGFEVAILGPANAGKSTLLNRLAGRDVALTSEIAGTTRDVIEVRMDLRGLPVTVLDTAGIRETDDSVETLGIQRALDRAARCDLRVFLVNERDDPVLTGVQPEDIVLIGKADLRNDGDISGITGKGVDALVDRIGEVLEKRFSNTGLAIRQRHRVAIARSVERLDDVLRGMSAGHPIELLAEALRGTADTLGALVGKIGVEDLLDEIFASFCLGK